MIHSEIEEFRLKFVIKMSKTYECSNDDFIYNDCLFLYDDVHKNEKYCILCKINNKKFKNCNDCIIKKRLCKNT